jgi:phosphoserine aminotransferase
MPLDVAKYGIIYAGVQKNLAPAGMAVVIIDKSLPLTPHPLTPELMKYRVMIDTDSMLNTPACYTIYMLGLVLKWIKKQGGLEAMAQLKAERSKLLYDVLDDSGMFTGHAEKSSRSDMNVTFRSKSKDLDDVFVKEAQAAGFENLKGHRATGGMRASIYNAMPVEGVRKLAGFMRGFEVRYRSN